MAEWMYAESDPAEELAELHSFSVKKRRPERDVEPRGQFQGFLM